MTAATAVTPPKTAKATTSVDPLFTAAVAQAKAAMAAQQQPILDEQAASDAQFKQRGVDATNEATALSNLLKPFGDQINNIYQTAGQNQELAGKGFSDAMQGSLTGNTNDLNAMLSKLAPAANATLDSHASQAGDMLYNIGGYQPGKTFAQQGATAGAALKQTAADALLSGEEQVKSQRAQAIVADQGFQQKIAELAGKLPGDIQTNYQHLQQIALSDAKFREQVANDKNNAAYKQAELKLAGAKYATSVDEFNAKQQYNYAKLAQQQANSNRSYGLALDRLKIASTTLQMKITANAFKAANGGYSQAAVNKFVLQANAAANLAWNGSSSSKSSSTQAYDAAGNPVGTKSGSRVTNTTTGAHTPYFQALAGMMKKGTPVQIAMDALDAVYPSNARPTPDAILTTLGPLAPQAIHDQIIKGALMPGLSPQDAINLSRTDPTQLIAGSRPEVKPIKTAAFHMAQQYGWSDTANLNALDALWTQESGWNPNAKNPSSGALGIPQELGHKVPANYATDVGVQLKWGLDYIHGRYGSPLAAWAHEQRFNWY